MAAYYKVEVTLNSQAVQVGLPSPQSVNVVLPLIGPTGSQGPAGPTDFTQLDNVPATFPPSAHTHTPSEVGLGNVANAAQVTAVTGTAPIVSSGGTTPAISISAATTAAAGSMSAADKLKLDGIAAGAEVNVNADWNASSGDAQIINKPTLGGAAALNVGTTAGTVAAGNDSRFADAAALTTGTLADARLSSAVAFKTQSADMEITDNTKGIILKSPNNSRWRITINDDGTLARAALALMTLLAFAASGMAQVRDMVTDTNGTVITGRTNTLTFTNPATFSGTLTATGNVTMSGTANTAPLQTASSGASLMTRELSDARYGERTVLYLTNSVSVTNSTTPVDTPLSASLPVGNYLVRSALFAENAAAAPGHAFQFGFTGVASPQRLLGQIGSLSTSGIRLDFPLTVTRSVSNSFIAVLSVQGFVRVTQTGTLTVKYAQQTATTNVSQLKEGFLEVVRLP
jgi:hypothetical protein